MENIERHDAATSANRSSEGENNMHVMHMSSIVGLSFAGCLLLQALAVAILLLGKSSRLKGVGSAILRYTSWAVFALPVFILAGFVTENLDPSAIASYVYPIGTGALCVFAGLYLKFE